MSIWPVSNRNAGMAELARHFLQQKAYCPRQTMTNTDHPPQMPLGTSAVAGKEKGCWLKVKKHCKIHCQFDIMQSTEGLTRVVESWVQNHPVMDTEI